MTDDRGRELDLLHKDAVVGLDRLDGAVHVGFSGADFIHKWPAIAYFSQGVDESRPVYDTFHREPVLLVHIIVVRDMQCDQSATEKTDDIGQLSSGDGVVAVQTDSGGCAVGIAEDGG